MNPSERHKWVFPARFRVRQFGWKASRLACQRLREAVSEIKKVSRKDPVYAADGAVRLMEKLWPALEAVDSSSGALGAAVYRTLQALLPILIDAPADRKTRDRWLDRLWKAKEEDGVGYLDPVGGRWGELCGSKDVASTWANQLITLVRWAWTDPKPGSYFHGSTACLSCLLAAERYQELLDLLELDRPSFWPYRRFGVEALLALDKKDEALAYAEASRGLNVPDEEIDRTCEQILLSVGRDEEAYQRYALTAHGGNTYLARFRNIAKQYPMKNKGEILDDLIASTPGEEGKWFATAKEIGRYDLALELASRSPCDPKTLNRAARDYLESNTRFALGAAIASLRWLAADWGYDITDEDVTTPFDLALAAAERLGVTESVEEELRHIIAADQSQGKFVQQVLGPRLEPAAPS